MKKIRIQYYAMLREATGCREEACTTEAKTPAGLYTELQNRYGFKVPKDRINVGVNHEMCGWDQELNDGDVIVFIPPVAGG